MSTPDNPVEVGSFDTIDYASGVYISGDYAYVANGVDGLWIIDVSRPEDPTDVGFFDTGGLALGVYVTGNYVYVADGDDGLYILRNDLITREDMESHYLLYQNYPNPFNSVTTIRFRIPFSEHVTLKVFDMIGREVETLIDKRYIPGEHEIEWSVSYHASGVYIYRLRAGDFVETKKLILLQ